MAAVHSCPSTWRQPLAGAQCIGTLSRHDMDQERSWVRQSYQPLAIRVQRNRSGGWAGRVAGASTALGAWGAIAGPKWVEPKWVGARRAGGCARFSITTNQLLGGTGRRARREAAAAARGRAAARAPGMWRRYIRPSRRISEPGASRTPHTARRTPRRCFGTFYALQLVL